MRKIVLVMIGGCVIIGGAALSLSYRSGLTPEANAPVDASPVAVDHAARPPAETFAAVFEPCAHCHQIGEGAQISTGPILTGIVGQPAAAGDYPYSPAMQNAGIVWDRETLQRFLIAPAAVVPGSRMYFGGLSAPDAEAIIDFLENPRPDARS